MPMNKSGDIPYSEITPKRLYMNRGSSSGAAAAAGIARHRRVQHLHRPCDVARIGNLSTAVAADGTGAFGDEEQARLPGSVAWRA
jgi:hypothetical protein